MHQLLRPLRHLVWSEGATRIAVGLIHDLVINQYGRADDIICQAAACGQCFPTAVPHRRRSPRCYRLSFRRHPCAARATFIAFLQHAENTVAGGSRLRCPLYSGHRNCTSSPFAAVKVWFGDGKMCVKAAGFLGLPFGCRVEVASSAFEYGFLGIRIKLGMRLVSV